MKEPIYRGAVVIDGEGRRWVRITVYSERPWYRTAWIASSGELPRGNWDEIPVPRTLVNEERLSS